MNRIFIIISTIFFSMFMCVHAQAVQLEASLEDNHVSLGNPIYLNITCKGAQDINPPNIENIDGLKIQYVGPYSKTSIVNGKVSISITHSYLIVPLKEGNFEIGPFFIDYNGQTLSAPPVTLFVSGTPASGIGNMNSRTSSGQQARSPVFSQDQSSPKKMFLNDKVFMELSASNDVLYINEKTEVIIKIYVDANMGLKCKDYPVFDYQGFSADDWQEVEKGREVVNGTQYGVLTFKRMVAAIKEGEYELGPAKIECQLVVPQRSSRRSSFFKGRSIFDDDFFSNIVTRNEVHPMDLESNVFKITVLPFPSRDKPDTFQGAAGDFRFDVSVEPKKVKVGDPITVRMAITGNGNMDTVSAPKIDISDDIKSYEPQVTTGPGKKVYEQILVPKDTKVKEIPAIEFSFFDTNKHKYVTLKQGPFRIEVQEQPEGQNAVKVVSIPGNQELVYPKETLGKDIVHIKDQIGEIKPVGKFLYNDKMFWVFQVIPFLLFTGLYVSHMKKERIRSDVGYARFLRAPGKAKKGIKKARDLLKKKDLAAFYDAIHITLQEYFSNKFNLPKGSITYPVLEMKAIAIKCNEDILKMLKDVFSGCDMARYAPSALNQEEANKVLSKVRKIIDYFEKIRI